MTFAVDFGYGTIAASAHFPIGSMPFPEITTATTKLSANVPARSGLTAGGTSYMIPAGTSGKALRASILFLQFMSARQYITNWLAETGGIAAIQGITPPASAAAYFEGAWGKPEIINPFACCGYDIAPGVLFTDAYDGYLLGSKTSRPGGDLPGGSIPTGRGAPGPDRRLDRRALGVVATQLAVAD